MADYSVDVNNSGTVGADVTIEGLDDISVDSTITVEDEGRLYRFEAFYTIREYLDWAAKHPDLALKN